MAHLQSDSFNLRFKLLVVLCLWISAVTSCEVACYPPSTPTLHNATEELAVAEGRCYTACLDRYQDYIPSSSYINYGNWSSVSYALLESHTCAHLQRVMECKISCLSRVHTHFETDNECRDDCDNKCVLECGTGNCTYGPIANCTRKCRRPACRIGCEEFSLNFGVNTTGNQPDIPLLPLQIMPNGDAGVYTVQNPIVNSMDSLPPTPSSFVFRVEENGKFDYFWQPSLEEDLQLSAYSCRNVKISYAAVNKYGRSSYSPVNSFCIRGDYYYPQQVTQVNFEYSEDHRPEFLKHAITNISWEKPADFKFLTGYSIAITPTCSGPQAMITIDNIPKNATWIVHRADRPGHPLQFGCTYLIQLHSLPIKPELTPATKLTRPILTNTVGPLTLSCRRKIHLNKTITVDVSWSVDSEDFAISSFNVDVQLMLVDSPTTIPDTLSSSQLPMKANNSSYEFTSGLLQSFFEVNRKYVILVTPVKNLTYFWRTIPHQTECVINATISPGPPNQISFDTISVKSNETSSFNASWSQPSPPFGTITAFEILVGRSPIAENESNTSNFYSRLVSGNTTNVILYASEITGQSSCNYLQIRSHNGIAWSTWSTPLSLNDLQLDCMPTSSTPIPSSTATSVLSSNLLTPSVTIIEHSPALSTTAALTPVQTSVLPEATVPQHVMYVVYSLSAFTAVLLILSAVFLVVLVFMKYSRIREDKISAVESDPETSSLKKAPVAILNVRKAEENIYDSFPTRRDGDNTVNSLEVTKPDLVIVSTV